jgi:hypothetical protein
MQDGLYRVRTGAGTQARAGTMPAVYGWMSLRLLGKRR